MIDGQRHIGDIHWWRAFWEENDRCLHGEQDQSLEDARPVRPAFSAARARVPVLVELGEDWIVWRTDTWYGRYIQDFEYQQGVRDWCAALLMDDIAFHLKAKVDSSSLLHGSVYGMTIEYPKDSTPWLNHMIHGPEDIKRLISQMEKADLSQAGLVPWFVSSYRSLARPYRWRILHDSTSVHGPGTILGFLFGINDMMLAMHDQPRPGEGPAGHGGRRDGPLLPHRARAHRRADDGRGCV